MLTQLYTVIFQFLDSFPTSTFVLSFLPLYLLLHRVVYKLLLLSSRFRDSDYDRRSYILCSVVESSLLSAIRFIL